MKLTLDSTLSIPPAAGLADLVTCVIDDVEVVACAALHGVGADAAIQRIVAGAADQRIVALDSLQLVVAAAAVQRVAVEIADDEVVQRVAGAIQGPDIQEQVSTFVPRV